MNEWFSRVATVIAKQVGSAWFFVASLGAILLWLVAGPFYQWSEGWQLVMNSATTVLTWQLAILILNTQNRDTKALHVKIDELVKAMPGAANELTAAEKMTDRQLDQIKQESI